MSAWSGRRPDQSRPHTASNMKTDWLNSVLQHLREIESGDSLALEPDRAKEEKKGDRKEAGSEECFTKGKM